MSPKRKKNNVATQMAEDVAHWKSLLGSFLVLAVFAVHPLIINRGYHDIDRIKQFSFCFIVISSVVLLTVITLLATSVIPDYLRRTDWRGFLRAVRPYEYALIAYWLVMFLSTLQADYTRIALLGSSNRNEGLLMMTVYILAAVVAGRCYKPRRRDLLILCAVATVVAAYGICQFYGFDFLRFEDAPPSYGAGLLFISTMSNRNVSSSYFCLSFSICVALFTQGGENEKHGGFLPWIYLLMGWVQFYMLILGTTESGYVGLLLSFVILFPMLARTRRLAARFLFMMAGCLSLVVLTVRMQLIGGRGSEWSQFVSFLLPASLTLAVVAALLYFLPGLPDELPQKPFRIGWYLLILIGMIAAIAAIPWLAEATGYSLFVDANAILKGNFSDEVGSGRLFVWKRALPMIPDRLLLGHGPDNFDPVFNAIYREEAGIRYDKAHNEYLQVLFDNGALGLLALLAFFALVMKSAIKRLREPMVLAVLLALCCFMIQAFFNIFSPFAHPVAWVLWGFLAALAYGGSENEAAKRNAAS